MAVLNLVINGLPSILIGALKADTMDDLRFKPCYKWITFNTNTVTDFNGYIPTCFKPCYKWITFNT